MSVLVAMTLPALVVLLVVAGAVEVLLGRRRRAAGGRTTSHVASAGFDALGLALAPSTKHKKEHDEFMELTRDEAGDSAPPRSRVDLDSGIARIVVPSPGPTPPYGEP
jgi:hypothetical protein